MHWINVYNITRDNNSLKLTGCYWIDLLIFFSQKKNNSLWTMLTFLFLFFLIIALVVSEVNLIDFDELVVCRCFFFFLLCILYLRCLHFSLVVFFIRSYFVGASCLCYVYKLSSDYGGYVCVCFFVLCACVRVYVCIHLSAIILKFWFILMVLLT